MQVSTIFTAHRFLWSVVCGTCGFTSHDCLVQFNYLACWLVKIPIALIGAVSIAVVNLVSEGCFCFCQNMWSGTMFLLFIVLY